MSPSGLITGAAVSNLGHDQFRTVLNRLLIVEACLHKVPLADMDLSCRDNDPDAGIDARISWPAGAKHDEFLPGETVLQFKSGKITLANIKTEFSKPGVRKALKNGGRYLLLVGHDYVGADADRRRADLKKLCRNRRISPKRCQILFGSQIARWVSRHASVMLMSELGLGYPAFVTVEGWLQHPELQNPWKPDDVRSATIEQIELFARRETQSYLMRIEGPAGVGKTRVALEGLRRRGIAETAIYTPNADEATVTQLLTTIQGNPEAEALVVVDECDRERQEMLKPYADLALGRIRILCVGPWDVLSSSPTASPNVFVIAPLSQSKIREILSAAVGTITQEVSDIAVRLAGGYVKLALFVTFYVSRQKDISPAELAKIHDVRTFLKRFVDKETRRALELLSLLARLGWEDELKDEAEALAKHLDVPMPDFKKGVKALRDRGVVVPRGRYLYVSPDLLAISAAADLWDEIGPGLIDVVTVLPREGPRRELLKRLASMGTHPTVRKAVETLLGTEGLFKKLPELDNEFRSEAFAILASALPDAAITVLERLVERAPREKLQDFRKGRRNVIWAIESLLRWPSISLTAARSLMALALSENETWANNATGVFREYFHMHLSRSPIPISERLILIDELIELDDSTSRLLAAKALAAALTRYETRSGGNTDPYSGQAYPDEWRPTTWGEVWRSFEATIERLTKIAVGDDEAAANARRSLVDATFGLVGQGMQKQSIQILETASPRSDQERRQLLDVSRRLARDLSDRFSAEQIEQLREVAKRCFDDSYIGRLKRWIGRRLYTDFNAEDPNTGEHEISLQIQALAEEGYRNGIADTDLAWLASPEAENVWVFGFRLGQLDQEQSFLDRIVSISPQNANAVLFASYLCGQAEIGGESVRDEVLDRVSTAYPMLAFAGTWRGLGSKNGLERILRLVELGRISPESLGHLAWGSWTNALPVDDVIRLVDVMLSTSSSALLDSISSILMGLLSKRPESLEKARNVIWRLIGIKPDRSWEWQWGQLASKMTQYDAKKVIEIVVGFFEDEDFIPIDSDETMKVLQTATVQDPESAWQVVGNTMLKDDKIGMRLVISLSRGYGELIPAETLISWAKNHLPKGPWIVSRIITVREIPLPERARAVVAAFPNDGRVMNEFAASLQTGFSMGPLSNRISSDLAIAEGWTRDTNPTVRSWAQNLVRGIKAHLKRQQILEEEEQF